jgi:hypothetical protein
VAPLKIIFGKKISKALPELSCWISGRSKEEYLGSAVALGLEF